MALRPSQLRATAQDAAVLLPAAHAMASKYQTLKVPTVIIAGAGDRYVSARAHSVRLHDEVPDSRLTLVPGAGHMVHHVATREVMRAIEEEPALVG